MLHFELEVLNYSSLSKTGIGAGLESMSVNSVGWEGQVNPRVRILYFAPHSYSVCALLTHSSLQVIELQKAQDCLLPMGITSENVAQRYGVTRQEQDQAAVSSSGMHHVLFLLLRLIHENVIKVCFLTG